MTKENDIPLANLYRMLCYAWGRTSNVQISTSELASFDRIEDLFGAILTRATADIVRRGLARGPVDFREDLRAPRGKLQLSETMKRQLPLRGRVACVFDEWSADIQANRILRSAHAALLPEVSAKAVEGLKRSERALGEATVVPFTTELFRTLATTAGQRYYSFAMDVCKLLAQWCLPSTDGVGRQKFIDPRTSQQEMGWIFESFVRRYLQEQLVDHRVWPERKLEWALTADSPAAKSVIPSMQTDIRLVGPAGISVIETKFTGNALPPGRDGTGRLSPEHLYQLHAYVTHIESRYPLERAVLLIGGPSARFLHRYRMKGADWVAASVDLCGSWETVCETVREAVGPKQAHGPVVAFASQGSL